MAGTSVRYHSLDSVRGVAALSVVVYHWHHFFFRGFPSAFGGADILPLSRLLGPLYSDGWRAVDFFFSLSGFIFFLLYGERIASGKVGPGEFFVLRFSRLYPLHLATLLFVALGQCWMYWRHGACFVYSNNDLRHFLIQLFCASSLFGSGNRDNFNGPFWSVSVELLLYAGFFLLCAADLRKMRYLLALIVVGLALEFTPWFDVGRGMISFFGGGLAFQAFSALKRGPITVSPLALLALNVFVWVAVITNLRYDVLYHTYHRIVGAHALILGRDLGGVAFMNLTAHSLALVAFPLTIVSLALVETMRTNFGSRWAFLGNLSYSSYLLHFPLQLVFAAVALEFHGYPSWFSSPFVLLIFFSVLIGMSLAVYHGFERPAQQYLRSRFASPTG